MSEYKTIRQLINRYDYGGALDLLKDLDFGETDAAALVNSCRYAVNFDFKTAKHILTDLPEERKAQSEVKVMIKNLDSLIDGHPDAMFSELMENIKFQIVNEEYIDFLGRVYRFKEAILKYIFVKNHIGKSRFSLISLHMEKREVLKKLRKKYKIYNSNLMFGITTYIHRYLKKEFKYSEIEKILNSDHMNSLIELRNDSIVGHGFKGVSVDDIYRFYGNPYNVLDDFDKCLKKLDIKLFRYKYSIINEYIETLLDEL
ncbi:MAG: hypothetical protein JEZ08_15055 [Clostridiales bacterium]|nr:hypothetical protein [Clostridiales bacterium]